MTAGFEQERYWIERHKSLVGDPRSVGHLGRSASENLGGELALRAQIDQALKLIGPLKTVLDLGCGYGRVASCFIDAGYDYTGVDVSPDAIEQARKRAPRGRFYVANLKDWVENGVFDLVAVLYVFVHFVDDLEWRRFVVKALSYVKPGGGLFFADDFPPERRYTVAHAVQRPLKEYMEIFQEHGFEIDSAFAESLRKLKSGSRLQFARRL